MKRTSYSLSLSVLSLALLSVCATVALGQTRDKNSTLGQNREKYVISAKAGGINAVTGQASVHSKGPGDWHQLMITDDLQAGDRVRTASDGRVEILLNPGSYLRVGGNSEIELSNNTLANLEVKILRGTAIVEATGADGLELNINISTPHTRLAVVRGGLYRLNVVPELTTELFVRKGRVILNDSHTKVKGGNKVIFNARMVSVAKMTKAEEKIAEDVDLWSKDRGQILAQANRRISNRMLTSAFNDFRLSGRSAFGWGFRASGFWFFNSAAHCYTFVPLYNGFGSPYGGGYSTSIYGYGYGNGNYNPGYTGFPYPGNTGASNSGSSTTPMSGSMPTRSNPVNMPASSPAPSAPSSSGGGRVMPDRSLPGRP